MKINQIIKFGEYSFLLNFQATILRTPEKETIGITSRCKDGWHVLFFDFDGLTLDEVIDEMSIWGEHFQLSNIYIFENDKPDSYHAICLDKFPLWQAIDIIACTSADKAFIKAPQLYKKKRWVLRATAKGNRAKPKHIITINSENRIYTTSKAHRIFLEENYGMVINHRENEDNFDETIGICGYKTGAKID